MNEQKLKDVLKYLNLNLNKIPKALKTEDGTSIKSSDLRTENDYKIYKYISIKDINIMLTNTHRLDEPAKKIETINSLEYYFDKENKEEHNIVINTLENASIQKIENIKEEQFKFRENIPQTIKYNKDYLWQIYYIKGLDKYYMVVPLQETQQEAFLYVLKQKIANSDEQIYVPICNLNYDNKFADLSIINGIENMLNTFIGKWPMIYEVFDKNDNCFLDIIGKINVLDNIESDYKLHYEKNEELIDFYKLLQNLFFIQSEISNIYKFDMLLDKLGKIHFYYQNFELTNKNIHDFYKNEINYAIKSINEIIKIEGNLEEKRNKLKEDEKKLSLELLYKQKQISTFLECKKTFIGKIKFFFKKSQNKTDMEKETNKVNNKKNKKSDYEEEEIFNYDADDLIYISKKLQEKTNNASIIRMDIQNLNLKIDVLKKKIENASLYLKEIETHKKNIFDFWKFTNKDEQKQLEEATEVEKENKTKIQKQFILKEDFKKFAKEIDQKQRKNLKENEINTILVTFSKVFNDINVQIKNGKITSENYEKLKEEQYIDINDTLLEHREKSRDLNRIINLETIDFNTYQKEIEKYVLILNEIFKKNKTENNIVAYCLNSPQNEFVKLDLNPKNIIDLERKDTISISKVNLKAKTPIIAFSNIVFFYNRNKTLPLGMDYSTNLVADLRDASIIKIKEKTNYIIDLSNNTSKRINIIEFNN